MAGNSKITINDAILAMESAYQRLTDATDTALLERANFAAQSEATQEEITASWVTHTTKLEAEIAQLTSENAFLKDDNLRLANQLQTLQKEFIELQRSTGDVIGTLDRSVRQLDLILKH